MVLYTAMDEIQIYNVLLNSNDRLNKLTTTGNNAEFYLDWASILPEGKYKVKYSIVKKPLPVTLTFLTSGSFTVPNNVSKISEFFILGGGGAGGADSGSGGGAGQYRLINDFNVSSGQTYAITIGAGGVGATNQNGTNGESSSFGTLFALGGQGGTNVRFTENTGPYGNTAGGNAVVGYSSTTPSLLAVNCFRGGYGSPTSGYFGGSGAGCNGAAGNATGTYYGTAGNGIFYRGNPYGGGGSGGCYIGGFGLANYSIYGGGVRAMRVQRQRLDARTRGSGGGGGGYGGDAGGSGMSGICIITFQP
jgi:hypothetical protein